MSSRLSLWLLASAGVLVGHVLGYAAAYPGEVERSVALAGHGYLGPVGLVLVPVGLAAVLATAVRTVRRTGGAPSLRTLAVTQAVVFVWQEVGERVVGPGHPADVLTERAVWLGLVAQVVVAWMVLRLVRFTVRVVRAVAAGPRPRLTAARRATVRPGARVLPARSIVGRLPGRRGPPRLGATPTA